MTKTPFADAVRAQWVILMTHIQQCEEAALAQMLIKDGRSVLNLVEDPDLRLPEGM